MRKQLWVSPQTSFMCFRLWIGWIWIQSALHVSSYVDQSLPGAYFSSGSSVKCESHIRRTSTCKALLLAYLLTSHWPKQVTGRSAASVVRGSTILPSGGRCSECLLIHNPDYHKCTFCFLYGFTKQECTFELHYL